MREETKGLAYRRLRIRNPRLLGVIHESEVPHVSPQMRIRSEAVLEATVIHSPWHPPWFGAVEIDGIEYVFLASGDERTGRECGCTCASG